MISFLPVNINSPGGLYVAILFIFLPNPEMTGIEFDAVSFLEVVLVDIF